MANHYVINPKKKQNKVWIIYDGRAEFIRTDDCSIYVTCSSIKEARSYEDMFPNGVIFEYDLVDNIAVNEKRVY